MQDPNEKPDRLERTLLVIRSLISVTAGTAVVLLAMFLVWALFVDEDAAELADWLAIAVMMVPVLLGGLTSGALAPRRPLLHGPFPALVVLALWGPIWLNLIEQGYLTGATLSAIVALLLAASLLGGWLGGQFRRFLLRRRLERLQR